MLLSCTVQSSGQGPAPEPPPAIDPEFPSGPETGRFLRFGLSHDPHSIDPRFVVDPEGALIASVLFEPLVRWADGELVPGAAESWEMSDSGRAFTFELREAAFHDGQPVTAWDFKRAFDRIADGTAEPPSTVGYLLDPVVGSGVSRRTGTGLAGVVVDDERTLSIRLSSPLPGFLTVLANPSLVPVPPRADIDLAGFGESPIGNGPFAMVESRERGSFIRVASHDPHHRAPRLDEVLFQMYVNDVGGDRQWGDLVDGHLHVGHVSADHLSEAEVRFPIAMDGYSGPGLLRGAATGVYMYGFDTTRPPFDDERVRRALSMSIDRETIAEVVMRGTRLPADGLVPPSVPGSQPGSCSHCRHDPDEARRLWTEAAPDLESLTLSHVRGRTHAAIAERMRVDIEAALDIEVTLHARDFDPFVAAVRDGDVRLFWRGWDVTELEPGAYLYPLFHSDSKGLDNLVGFSDPIVDQWLDLGRTALVPAVSAARFRQAERHILAQAPVIPLLWYRHSLAVSEVVSGFRLDPSGVVDLAEVSVSS